MTPPILDDMWGAYDRYAEAPMDWVSNIWGWPTIFGIGAAEHPIDPDYDMIWIVPTRNWVVVWDERLQLEYGR